MSTHIDKKKMTHLFDLPDEMLIEICSHLSFNTMKLMFRVHRRFRDLRFQILRRTRPLNVFKGHLFRVTSDAAPGVDIHERIPLSTVIKADQYTLLYRLVFIHLCYHFAKNSDQVTVLFSKNRCALLDLRDLWVTLHGRNGNCNHGPLYGFDNNAKDRFYVEEGTSRRIFEQDWRTYVNNGPYPTSKHACIEGNFQRDDGQQVVRQYEDERLIYEMCRLAWRCSDIQFFDWVLHVGVDHGNKRGCLSPREQAWFHEYLYPLNSAPPLPVSKAWRRFFLRQVLQAYSPKFHRQIASEIWYPTRLKYLDAMLAPHSDFGFEWNSNNRNMNDSWNDRPLLKLIKPLTDAEFETWISDYTLLINWMNLISKPVTRCLCHHDMTQMLLHPYYTRLCCYWLRCDSTYRFRKRRAVQYGIFCICQHYEEPHYGITYGDHPRSSFSDLHPFIIPVLRNVLVAGTPEDIVTIYYWLKAAFVHDDERLDLSSGYSADLVLWYQWALTPLPADESVLKSLIDRIYYDQPNVLYQWMVEFKTLERFRNYVLNKCRQTPLLLPSPQPALSLPPPPPSS